MGVTCQYRLLGTVRRITSIESCGLLQICLQYVGLTKLSRTFLLAIQGAHMIIECFMFPTWQAKWNVTLNLSSLIQDTTLKATQHLKIHPLQFICFLRIETLTLTHRDGNSTTEVYRKQESLLNTRFGLLKSKWRRLLFVNAKIENVVRII